MHLFCWATSSIYSFCNSRRVDDYLTTHWLTSSTQNGAGKGGQLQLESIFTITISGFCCFSVFAAATIRIAAISIDKTGHGACDKVVHIRRQPSTSAPKQTSFGDKPIQTAEPQYCTHPHSTAATTLIKIIQIQVERERE